MCACVCVCVLVAQLCPILCNSWDCSLPGSSVLGILQARILEWVPIPFSRDLPNPGIKPSPHTAGRFFSIWATREALWEPQLPCIVSTHTRDFAMELSLQPTSKDVLSSFYKSGSSGSKRFVTHLGTHTWHWNSVQAWLVSEHRLFPLHVQISTSTKTGYPQGPGIIIKSREIHTTPRNVYRLKNECDWHVYGWFSTWCRYCCQLKKMHSLKCWELCFIQ